MLYGKLLHGRTYRGLVLATCLLGWLLLGFGLVKRNQYFQPDVQNVKDVIVANYSQFIFRNQRNLSAENVLYGMVRQLQKGVQREQRQPTRDFLLVVNVLSGIEDDVHDRNTAFVTAYTFVGLLLSSAAMFGICQWLDSMVDWLFDDHKYCKDVSRDEPNRDLVREYKVQRRDFDASGKPIEIRATKVPNVEPLAVYETIRAEFFEPVKPISPAFFYFAAYMIGLFLVTALHTRISGQEYIDALIDTSVYTTGLGCQLLSEDRDFVDYIYVILCLPLQVLFYMSCWRLAQLIIDFYTFITGVQEKQRLIFFGALREE